MRRVFTACRQYFLTAVAFSLAINLLYLASPLYMLQIYDRVISSGSTTTLVMLTLALLLALGALAGLDLVRGQVLTRASVRLDRLVAPRVIVACVDAPGNGGTRSQPLRDFDTVRQFVTGPGIHAVFDLPWVPIYIGVIFLLHPALGLFALGSAAVLVVMALINEWAVRRPMGEANEAVSRSYSFTEMGLRNAEVVKALGMIGGLLRRWGRDRSRALDRQTVASDRAAAISSMIKFLRMAMQSIILGLGAYLAIERLTTVGAIFAASILLGRALQPVEQMVGSWRMMVSAQGAFGRVRDLLAATPAAGWATTLPRPSGEIFVENLHYALPGTQRLILRNISFDLSPGEVLGIVGPSGAGKSTLVRHLVGVLKPSAGAVRLDGAQIAIWQNQSQSSYLGYLPQDIELFADTIAANISRFELDADAAIVQAAQLAGVHEMILWLPQGYQTQVGEGGAVLSGGYRQRIALARAVFGRPSLVVLDEPSSNLDADGDAALGACIAQLKRDGTTIIIVSHRPATLAAVDKILVLRDGAVEAFDERLDVLARLAQPAGFPATGKSVAVGA